MNIEQVKEEAKKRFDKDLTDREAQILLEQYGGELSDELLQQVAGGVVPMPTIISEASRKKSFY